MKSNGMDDVLNYVTKGMFFVGCVGLAYCIGYRIGSNIGFKMGKIIVEAKYELGIDIDKENDEEN